MKMKRLPGWMIVGLMCGLSGGFAVSQTAAPKTSTGVLSKWDSSLAGWGLTESVFNENHLSRLTVDEIRKVTFGSYIAGMAAKNYPTVSCGPEGKTADLTKVKLYVSMPPETDADLASALR